MLKIYYKFIIKKNLISWLIVVNKKSMKLFKFDYTTVISQLEKCYTKYIKL